MRSHLLCRDISLSNVTYRMHGSEGRVCASRNEGKKDQKKKKKKKSQDGQASAMSLPPIINMHGGSRNLQGRPREDQSRAVDDVG